MKSMRRLIILLFIVIGLAMTGMKTFEANQAGQSTITVQVTSVFDQHNPNLTTTHQITHGSMLSFLPLGRENFTFAYWVVNGIVRYDLPYAHNFRVTTKLSLIAVFSPDTAHVVLFIDANGELISTQYVADGGFAVEPNLLNTGKPGLSFADPKWRSTYGKTTLTDIQDNTVFILQYVRASSSTFQIDVASGLGTGDYAYNSIVTLQKNPSEPLSFSHWSEGGQVVSMNSTYQFTALKERSVVANYSETPVDRVPTVYFSGDLIIRPDFHSYVGQVDLPENHQLIEYGFLMHPASASSELTVETPGVQMVQHDKMHPSTNEFMMSFPLNSHQSMKAYALVLFEGVYTYYYSPQSHQPVNVPVTRVVLFDGVGQLMNNESFDFSQTVYPIGANHRVSWTVSDPTKATIDKHGILTPVSGQTGSITVTSTSVSNPAINATYAVTIVDSNTTITNVSTYQELVAAVNGTATHIKLTNNIDASGQTFTPTRTNFTGIFDGQGYAIQNLSINGGSNNNTGLFRQIGGNAVIKDVTFLSPRITTSQANSGLIAGSTSSNGTITIRDVYVLDLVTTVTSSQWTHGGLIGLVQNTNHLRVFNTYLEYTFTALSGGANVGGAVGVVNNGTNAIVHVAHSYFDVKVNGTSTGGIYSAVIGQVNGTTGSRIDSVYASIKNIGSINVLSNAGLVYGQLNTAGANHFMSRVIHPSDTAYTRSFGQNNGSSQLNGTTSNANALVTSEVNLVSQENATQFVDRNSIWAYHEAENKISFDMSHIQSIFDNIEADQIEGQIVIANSSAIYSDVILQTLINSKTISWSSSNTSVVSNTGVVTRPVSGNQIVTLTYSFQVGSVIRTGDISLTVIEAYDNITPIEIEIFGLQSLYQGSSTQLSFTVTPQTIEPEVIWSILSGSETYASITSNGLVTALSPGNAIIVARLASDQSIVGEFELTVLLAPTVSVSLVNEGLIVNDPQNSQVYVSVNMPGTLYYVQNSTTQTAQQIINSGSKQTVAIENTGVSQIGVTVTSATKLQFVLVILDGQTVISSSQVNELTFTLLLPTVLVSTYSEFATALNRTDNINIKLTADIDASSQTFSSTKTTTFIGTLDGQGFKVINLSISANHQNSGLFRQIGGGAIFKDITFESPRISTNQANSALLAGRVATSGNILISNVKVIDFIQTITANQWTHGGLIGTINTGSAVVTVEDVYLDYTVQTTSASVSTGNIGGITGVQSSSSTLIVRHSLIDMKVSFANTNNTGQIISAVIGQVNSGNITNISYVYAGIRNTGAANALANAGIVYSQMNNAGTSHTVTTVAVLANSAVTKLTNNYNTSVNGANSAGHANITSQFHQTMTLEVGQAFVAAKASIWSYNDVDNVLSFNL